MSIPSASRASTTLESLRSQKTQPLAGSPAVRTWLAPLALAVVFLTAIYLAGLGPGTATEDFATIAVPP